jgi:hypothetical protein
VQAISVHVHAAASTPESGAGHAPCREYCRSEPQLRTHGAFSHPFLSSDVKLLLPLSSAGLDVSLVPGSQHWVEGSGGGSSSGGVEHGEHAALGSALLVDMRTWRSGPRAGAPVLEVHYSKFANKQHAALCESVARLDSAGLLGAAAGKSPPSDNKNSSSSSSSRTLLRQILGLEVASELAAPRHPTDAEFLAEVSPHWELRPRPPAQYDESSLSSSSSALSAQLQVSKCRFSRCHVNPEHLPRQALDKHRETHTKKELFSQQFRRDGFTYIRGLVHGEALLRMQHAFHAEQQVPHTPKTPLVRRFLMQNPRSFAQTGSGQIDVLIRRELATNQTTAAFCFARRRCRQRLTLWGTTGHSSYVTATASPAPPATMFSMSLAQV